MDRRKVIKTLGLSAAVIGTGFISACTQTGDNKDAKELQELKDSLKKTAEKPLSERDKKIVNRQEMTIKDTENPTELELKHTPEIKVGKKDDLGFTEVKIIIGTGIIHPTTVDHWIDYIRLYSDNQLIGNVEFEAGKASGFADFKIKTDAVKVLKAECGCNLHGIWQSEISLS